jgi:hypothetical protein
VAAPKSVALLGDGARLNFNYDAATRTARVNLPVAQRTKLVDVVAIELP